MLSVLGGCTKDEVAFQESSQPTADFHCRRCLVNENGLLSSQNSLEELA